MREDIVEQDEDDNQHDEDEENDDDEPYFQSFIYNGEDAPCYISVDQANEFVSQKNFRTHSNPNDACSTLSVFLERVAYLDYPDPLNSN